MVFFSTLLVPSFSPCGLSTPKRALPGQSSVDHRRIDPPPLCFIRAPPPLFYYFFEHFCQFQFMSPSFPLRYFSPLLMDLRSPKWYFFASVMAFWPSQVSFPFRCFIFFFFFGVATSHFLSESLNFPFAFLSTVVQSAQLPEVSLERSRCGMFSIQLPPLRPLAPSPDLLFPVRLTSTPSKQNFISPDEGKNVFSLFFRDPLPPGLFKILPLVPTSPSKVWVCFFSILLQNEGFPSLASDLPLPFLPAAPTFQCPVFLPCSPLHL